MDANEHLGLDLTLGRHLILFVFFAVELTQYRPVQWFLKPLFFEVPQRDPNPVFTGRQWLFRELSAHLSSDLPTNKGAIISGVPGSGKTAIILQLVQHSCFGPGELGCRGKTCFV